VVTRDQNGQIAVTGVIATKLFNNHWTIASAFAVDHERHISGGVEVKATW